MLWLHPRFWDVLELNYFKKNIGIKLAMPWWIRVEHLFFRAIKPKRDVGMVPFMLLNNARNILLNNFLYNYILLTLDVAPEKVGKKFL